MSQVRRQVHHVIDAFVGKHRSHTVMFDRRVPLKDFADLRARREKVS